MDLSFQHFFIRFNRLIGSHVRMRFAGKLAIILSIGSASLTESSLAKDLSETEVLVRLKSASSLLVRQDPITTLGLLVKLRNETSFFNKNPTSRTTQLYVRLYEIAYTAKKANEYLNSCGGGLGSLQIKSSDYSRTAALASTESCKTPKPVFNEIISIANQAKKIVESPENERWFSQNLKTIIVAQSALDARNHTDFLGTSRGLGGNSKLSNRARRDFEQEIQKLKIKQETAVQNMSLYSQESTEFLSEFVDEKIGIDKVSLGREKNRLAEQLHLEVMAGNRKNCLSNYLFFTQNFDFSGVEPIERGYESQNVMSTALDLFGRDAQLGNVGIRQVSSLPEFTCDDPPANKHGCEKTENYLARYGVNFLENLAKSRNGAPPYTLNQIYSSLRSDFADLTKGEGSSPAHSDKASIKANIKKRQQKLDQLVKKSKFRFLLDTTAFRNSVDRLQPGLDQETILKTALREALQEASRKHKKSGIL